MLNIKDNILGCLLGLAIGDRIGGPTRMALLLAQSLVDRQAFDSHDLSRKYLQWWKCGAFDTGHVFHEVYRLVDQGLSQEEAVLRVHDQTNGETAGCNPSHRCFPLALAGYLSERQLVEALETQARLTHWHSLAAEGSVFVGLLCRCLVTGMPFYSALNRAFIGQEPSIEHSCLRSEPKPNGFTPDVIGASIHFISHASGFDDALHKSLAFAGDENYCPVIVGAVAGALWGRKDIQDEWDIDKDTATEIIDIAESLTKSWAGNISIIQH